MVPRPSLGLQSQNLWQVQRAVPDRLTHRVTCSFQSSASFPVLLFPLCVPLVWCLCDFFGFNLLCFSASLAFCVCSSLVRLCLRDTLSLSFSRLYFVSSLWMNVSETLPPCASLSSLPFLGSVAVCVSVRFCLWLFSVLALALIVGLLFFWSCPLCTSVCIRASVCVCMYFHYLLSIYSPFLLLSPSHLPASALHSFMWNPERLFYGEVWNTLGQAPGPANLRMFTLIRSPIWTCPTNLQGLSGSLSLLCCQR